MSEVSERYNAVAHGFTTRLEAVGPEMWSRGTPCSDWTVRDLVAHVTTTHRRVIATVQGTEPVDTDLEADLLLQWGEATRVVAEALADEVVASTVVGGMFGDQSFASLVGRMVCADALIHTWDLARATGQDETLAAGAVAKAMEALAPLDEAIRRPGGFGAKIAPAPDADAQTEFLNFCGRSV